MKKIFTLISAVVVSLTVMCVTAFAATEDVELSVTRAKATNGLWGQSITYSKSDFDASRLTPDSQIFVEYELDGEMPANGWHPVELIFQRYEIEPVIWAQIAPVEFSETAATFNYADILAVYTDKGGAEDFSDVNNVCFGDSGVVMTVTKVTVTNCNIPETTVAATEATTTEAVTEAETTTAAPETEPAETTAAQQEEKADDKDSEDKLIVTVIIIAVAVVVVAAVVVVIIVVKKNRRRFY
ncbi:MAG: hypothetical protein IJZ72_00850 [Oscillospiraceae bacterium]|nr:hypothetical protein [Oscillospiraceae bacterium]